MIAYEVMIMFGLQLLLDAFSDLAYRAYDL